MFTTICECFRALSCCMVLSLTYVSSLYIWRTKDSRNHPSTIRKRFLSVLFMAILSPCFVLFGCDTSYFKKETSLWRLMGFQLEGLLTALVFPLILTAVLFSGPILIRYMDGVYRLYLNSHYWTMNIKNVFWLRNHIVAPFSEEFTFRACMLPILMPCLGDRSAIFICPLFFGIAHLHHLIERLESNSNFKQAVFHSFFQFGYTTIFGIYSSYLFLRTGHFASSFVVHAFCNHMGFPDFGEIFQYRQPFQTIISAVFVAGLVVWILLLTPLTQPDLYGNNLYWQP